MWNDELLRQLVWKVRDNEPATPRPSQYQAPTWSWASVNMEVRFEHAFLPPQYWNCFGEVLDVTTALATSDPFGQVLDGYLKLKVRNLQCGFLGVLDDSGRYEMFLGDIEADLHVGWVQPDTSRNTFPDGVFYLTLGEYSYPNTHELFGLVLEKLNSPSTFQRVGFFTVKDIFYSDLSVEEFFNLQSGHDDCHHAKDLGQCAGVNENGKEQYIITII